MRSFPPPRLLAQPSHLSLRHGNARVGGLPLRRPRGPCLCRSGLCHPRYPLRLLCSSKRRPKLMPCLGGLCPRRRRLLCSPARRCLCSSLRARKRLDPPRRFLQPPHRSRLRRPRLVRCSNSSGLCRSTALCARHCLSLTAAHSLQLLAKPRRGCTRGLQLSRKRRGTPTCLSKVPLQSKLRGLCLPLLRLPVLSRLCQGAALRAQRRLRGAQLRGEGIALLRKGCHLGAFVQCKALQAVRCTACRCSLGAGGSELLGQLGGNILRG